MLISDMGFKDTICYLKLQAHYYGTSNLKHLQVCGKKGL